MSTLKPNKLRCSEYVILSILDEHKPWMSAKSIWKIAYNIKNDYPTLYRSKQRRLQKALQRLRIKDLVDHKWIPLYPPPRKFLIPVYKISEHGRFVLRNQEDITKVTYPIYIYETYKIYRQKHKENCGSK